MRQLSITLKASSILWLLAISQASGLVIRHDTPTLDYENYGKESKFNASTGISRANDYEYGIAGATAIDSRWGVHARHTLRNVETWMDAGNGANLRGTKWNGWNYQGLPNVGVKEVIHFDDDFTRFANAIDIAVVQTNAASSVLRIAPLYNSWDEVGRVGSGVSAANNRQDGNGNSRKTEAQNTSNSGRWYEVRWGGKNDINQVNTQSLGSPSNALLKCDLDHPTTTSFSIMGGNTAIDLEYGTMNGDSGSPIYIDKNGLNGQVSGVLSGGSGNTYGSSLVYVRIRPYKTWITDTILANPDNRAVYIATIPDQVITLGGTLNVTESSTGTEQGPLTPSFSLVTAPTGMTIDPSTGAISWTPTVDQAGMEHTITVRVTEDGVVANNKDKSFNVTVLGAYDETFWTWSSNPAVWSSVTTNPTGNGGPYRLNTGTFPYLQGDANSQIYQQINDTLPAWADVTVQIKAADFEQTWTSGGELEYGFTSAQPTVANAGDPFLHSAIADVPNYNGDPLVDGLGNTGGNVDYYFTFETTTALVNPWFAVRKNANGGRFAVDDIVIGYSFTDTDEDGLPDRQEDSIGTNPDVADSDGDGLEDGDELANGTDPLDPDSDLDGYNDGHEVNTIATDPLDPESPGGPNPEAIGINFVASGGASPNIKIPANAYAGEPAVAQKNWNETSPFNASSGANGRILTPQAGVIVDSAGNTTSVTTSYTMANTWSANNEKITPYGYLCAGYIDTSAGTPNAVINLSNIPYASYDVYVYFGNNSNTPTTGAITDGATTYSFSTIPKSPTTPNSFVRTTDTASGNPSANYALFTDKSGPNCTITYQRGSYNGGIFAIQIVRTSTPYEEWSAGHALDPETNGGPDVDADFDGLVNLAEFVLYSNPAAPADRPMMLIEDQGPSTFSLTYQHAKAASDHTVVAKWSDDLDQWFETGIVTSLMDEDSEKYTYKATVPKDGKTARFVRLVITEP